MRNVTRVCLSLLAALVILQTVAAARAQDSSKLKFEMYKGANDQFHWRLKAGNGEVLATGGQGYKAKADCQHGIEVMQAAGDAKAKTKFEVYEDAKKEFRWRLNAANGQVVASSAEGYKAKADCEKAVELVKKAGKVPVDDMTKK
jgi:uncharacterized protein YegP (UPF0339 family)